MPKHIIDLHVVNVEHPHPDYALLKLSSPADPLPQMQALDLIVKESIAVSASAVRLVLTAPVNDPLPELAPGQFVEVRIDDTPGALLRRPISINYADDSELWLLVHNIGPGTARLCALQAGDTLNCLLPLGHGFTLPSTASPARPTQWRRRSHCPHALSRPAATRHGPPSILPPRRTLCH